MPLVDVSTHLMNTLENHARDSKYYKRSMLFFRYMRANSIIKCGIFGLVYREESCYIDSVLMALFSKQTDYIDDHILFAKTKHKQVQYDLQDIVLSTSGIKQVTHSGALRESLLRFPQKYNLSLQQDASEFLMSLFSLFDVDDAIREEATLVGGQSTKRVYASSIIYHNSIIDKSMDYTIKDLLSHRDEIHLSEGNEYLASDNKYYTHLTKIERLISSPYLIVLVNRIKFPHTQVDPDVTVFNLQLLSIVVWQNHHYTTYFTSDKNGDEWYYYDNISPILIKHIGSYSDMLKYRPSPVTKGVLYFYG